MNTPGGVSLEPMEDTGCRTLAVCLRQLVLLIEADALDSTTADEWIGRSKLALSAASIHGWVRWP